MIATGRTAEGGPLLGGPWLVGIRGGLDLDTRLGLERSRIGDDSGQTELALSGRIQALERMVDRLSVDLQRVQRTADDAVRLADAAQRTAEQAARAALR